MRRVRIPRCVARALLAAWAALAGLACEGGSSLWDPAVSSADPPIIVTYLVDTLRADALGAYGNASAHTPAVDALAVPLILMGLGSYGLVQPTTLQPVYLHSARTGELEPAAPR
jgi:hypothetical protein